MSRHVDGEAKRRQDTRGWIISRATVLLFVLLRILFIIIIPFPARQQ